MSAQRVNFAVEGLMPKQEPETDKPIASYDRALTAIARSTAYLALHAAELANSDLVAKATFLEQRLGLSRADCAAVLDSSVDSIRMAFNAAKKKAKGGRRG
jgi:hypothetical protein